MQNTPEQHLTDTNFNCHQNTRCAMKRIEKITMCRETNQTYPLFRLLQ